jgi:hypothetical protein
MQPGKLGLPVHERSARQARGVWKLGRETSSGIERRATDG